MDNATEHGSFLNRQSNGLLAFGAETVRVAHLDERACGMSLRLPATMSFEKAAAEAPAIYDEIDQARSGTSLLEVIRRYIRNVYQEAYADEWPDGLTSYQRLEPHRLQVLAQRVAAVPRTYSKEMAATSLVVYALLGLAAERELRAPARLRTCGSCYRTAASRSRYCLIHRVSRKERLEATKKKGRPDNRDVAHRRALRVKRIALTLGRDEQSIYSRLRRQLVGVTGALNATPPPLEQVEDNKFGFGARIGRNGADWLIYLWKVLPRVQRILGTDWPELVRAAVAYNEWMQVLDRLKREINGDLESTDAFQWAVALIEAERWAEADEIEPKRRKHGRPRHSRPPPRIEQALAQVHRGNKAAVVAREYQLPRSTLYYWKTKAATHSATRKSK